MNARNKAYISLMIWILGLIFVGSLIGSATKTEINAWYNTLNRSFLTPPNYIFPIAWSILYAMIATGGWIIWSQQPFPQLRLIKSLYIIQLILNWSWTPLFFRYHLSGFALLVLGVMDIIVSMIIYLTYQKIRSVSLFMIPYLIWIIFASYLNFYIWHYN